MNSNGILNQLRPNGYNGEIYNFRASNIFHFKPQTTPGSFPESGESGVYNECIALRNNLLTSIEEGLILSFIVPEGCSNLNKIYIFNNSTTPLNSEPIEIKISNLEVNKWYLMVYNGSNFSNVNIYPDNRVTYDSENAITSKAVYEYVSSIATSSLSYKICPPEASKIPAGVIYNDGNNTITGTLVADIQTEKIIYLVKNNSVNNDSYDEYLTILNNNVYSWEKIGSTGVNINSIIDIINPHTFTPSGSVSQPTFTGSKVATESNGAHTHSVTATGNVSSTFSGTQTTLSGTTEGHQHTIAAKELTVKGSVTAAGTVSKPTFTGSESTTSTEPAHSHDIAVGAISVTGTFNPSSINITAGGFTGTEADIKMGNANAIATSQDEHTHTIAAQDITINGSVTAAGTVSKPTFAGKAATIESTNNEVIESTSNSHNHSIAANDISVSTTYTPEGTVSTPTITVTPSAIVYPITGVGSASSFTVSNEVLTLTPNTVPTLGSAITFTGSSTQPTFNGTQATIISKNSAPVSISGGAHSHKLEAGTVKVNGEYTPAGSVSQPTFTGDAVNFSGQNKTDITISGGAHGHNIAAKAISLSTKYTPAGTIANPTITSTSVSVTSTNATAINTGDAGRHSHTVTAAGSVSQPTFTGSTVTVTSTNETDVITSKATDNVAINYTPAGTVTSTFTGTPATTDSKGAHTHSVTPEGTVSQPTFAGSEVTLEHEEAR